SRMKRAANVRDDIAPELVRDAQEKSKAMIRAGNDSRPFLDYILKNIAEAGYRNVVIVVGTQDDSIKSYYECGRGSEEFSSLNISYVIQQIPAGRTKPLGTADALLLALQSKPEWKGESFTVCNSDNLYSVAALRSLMKDSHANALIDYDRSALLFEQERIVQFAVIKKDEQGFLTDLIEKPLPEEIALAIDSSGRIGVSMNLFRLSYDMIYPFLEQLPLHPVRQEKELPVAVKLMAEQCPKSVWTIPRSEHVIDLTNQADIPVVREYLKREFPEF
ncbi:MAG: nucleotidyltransferase, partial [Bacteroidetes bacterium]